MIKNQFEKLIEYVINDENEKAKELFHQIVVAKSRQIYENIMQDEELDEDNAMGEEPTEIDMGMSEGDMDGMEEGMGSRMGRRGMKLGGSQSHDLIDDVEAEETGGMMEAEDDAEFDDEAEDDGEDLTRDMEREHDMGDDEAATKSDVMDLADKLDDLMAEFEQMMDGGNDMSDDQGDDGMDDDGMDDIEIDADEFETEGMYENVDLKAAPKPVTSEPAGTYTKSTTAFNSGATGMAAHPVRAGKNEGGYHDTAAYKNTTKDLIGKVGNSPAQAKQDLRPATKPQLGQAAGVNTRTPFPRGK
jgi:hypothetical protein